MKRYCFTSQVKPRGIVPHSKFSQEIYPIYKVQPRGIILHSKFSQEVMPHTASSAKRNFPHTEHSAMTYCPTQQVQPRGIVAHTIIIPCAKKPRSIVSHTRLTAKKQVEDFCGIKKT